MRKYWVLLLPLLALGVFLPAYAKRSKEIMPGPVEVRQLTFDSEAPSEVINEFAVASPDGKYFVVQRSHDPKLVTRPDGSHAIDFKESSNWDIIRYAVDGQHKLQLTSRIESEDQPTWSPDGQTLVYRMLNGKSFDLYLMDADGSHKRDLLIDPKHDEKTPAFSRDGKRVVFFSDRDGLKWNLYTIELATGQVVRLTHEPVEDKHPQFLPDGRVVFHSSRGSRKVTLEGGEEFHLMNLWVLDPATGQMEQITSSDGNRDNRHAWVSPDGRLIAYHSNIIEPDPKHPQIHRKAHRELCITTPDGTQRVNLTHNDPRNFKHPTWGADGAHLFFVYKEKGQAWNAGSMDVSEAVARLEGVH
jgi:Tol biopolymer transport system component